MSVNGQAMASVSTHPKALGTGRNFAILYYMTKELIRIGLDQAPPIPLHTSLYGGDFKGFEVDMLAQLADHLALEIVYSEAPWPVLFDQLEKGTIDAICSAATVTLEHRPPVVFGIPYLTFQLALVCRQDHLLTLDQLHEHPIGVRTESTAEQFLTEQLQQAPAFSSNSNDELYNLLLNGNIHGIIDDSPIAYGFLQEHQELAISTLLKDTQSQYAIAFVATRAALAEKVNTALQQLQESGFLRQLQEKWFGKEPL